MRTVRVYEVAYQVPSDHPNAYAGAAGDGSYIARFRRKDDAESFADAKQAQGCTGLYGAPRVDVCAVDVPPRLAQRWGLR
jgi:hypothetical protein